MERDSKVRNYLHFNVNGLTLGTSETRKFNTVKEKSAEKQGNQVKDKGYILQIFPRTKTEQEDKKKSTCTEQLVCFRYCSWWVVVTFNTPQSPRETCLESFNFTEEEKYIKTEKLPSKTQNWEEADRGPSWISSTYYAALPHPALCLVTCKRMLAWTKVSTLRGMQNTHLAFLVSSSQ